MNAKRNGLITVKELMTGFRKSELYSVLLLIPVVVYVIAITGNYTGVKGKPLIINTLVISLFATLLHYLIRKKRISNFINILNSGKNSLYAKLKADILSFPVYDARTMIILWIISPLVLLTMLRFQIDLNLMNILSIIIVVLLIIPFTYLLFYVCAENAMSELLSDPRLTAIVVTRGAYKELNLIRRIFMFVGSVALIPLGVLSFFLYLVTTGQMVLTQLTWHLVFITVLVQLCLGVSLYEMGISTKRSVSLLVSALGNISNGNLAIKAIPMLTASELGYVNQHVNTLFYKLKEVVNAVKDSAESLFLASNDTDRASNELASSASEQASGLEQLSSTMEELLSSVNQNADNAGEANVLSETSYRLAAEGTSIVNTAVQAINDVKESSNKISDIITLINEIAFQTNLLALNAAVEAARAGDSGRGFAVVAMEVRNLAQRSRSASDEIGRLIRNSVEKINTGTELVNRSGEALKDIYDSIEKTKNIITEINVSSREQKEGLGEITQSLSQADIISQHNASAAEELSSTSENLNQNSRELQELIGFFKI